MKILQIDPYLLPYKKFLSKRLADFRLTKSRLTSKSLIDFANGYEYFGIHPEGDEWVYREWAPGADAVYLIGEHNGWDLFSCPLQAIGQGVWEGRIKNLALGQRVETLIRRNGELLYRIPAYAGYVVQDRTTHRFCALVDDVLFDDFPWQDSHFTPQTPPLIYECHIGMAQEKEGVGSFDEFMEKVLPRIKKAGYNTIQLMAVMEHPYYGSFGYQVSNFYAVSSRFGTPRQLKELINRAHRMGIAVLLDVVHSHAVKNVGEGLNFFDGTEYQYFHQGERGNHQAWDTKLFDYAKPEVLHFLLSNLKYWMRLFHFDGFRFDGVTSMLYHDHGLGRTFDSYDAYFSENTDPDAQTYLMLANELIHALNPHAITIAEDMSGMPGMCLSITDGGIGFDYRLSMGLPDYWIRLLKECKDEEWDMHHMWYALTEGRVKEKCIRYAESHDQALVGDKTLMFWLCDAEMYWHMSKNSTSHIISRGMALHKMIRLITATAAGEGYLNFMGNEFGHPEWIDFPREGNGWSYRYCRRQWSLADDDNLRYGALALFDRAMLSLIKKEDLLSKKSRQEWVSQTEKVLIYSRGHLLFAFNFHPDKSFTQHEIPVSRKGQYRVVLSTDQTEYDGYGRVDMNYRYVTEILPSGRQGFLCYLPSRTAMVFRIIDE